MRRMLASDSLRPATLADIAKDVGVSSVTVAKVLHNTGGKNTRVAEKTAARIRESASQLQYVPNMVARRLAGKSSHLIGVAIDSCAPAVSHDRLSRMEFHAAARGYRFIIGQAHEDYSKIKSFARDFIAYGASGIICMAYDYPGSAQTIAGAYPRDKTVFFDRPEGVGPCCYVTIHVEKAFSGAVTYLAGRGRRRIGLLVVDNPFAEKAMNIRRHAYRRGLENADLPRDRAMEQPVPGSDPPIMAHVLPAVRTLARDLRADAIIACNDHMAAMTLKCLHALGLSVPRDVAVIGYDNVDWAPLVTPALTTFDDNRECAARAMVDMAIDLIQHPELALEGRCVAIDPFLVERESA